MRKGWLIGGIVLLVIGAIITAVAFSGSTQSESLPSGSCLVLTPATVGSDSVDFSWSGGSSGTTIELVDNCNSLNVLQSGGGSSGSFSYSLASGTTYGLANIGGGSPSVTLTQHGITILELIGIVLLVLGVLLAVVGAIRKPRMRPAMAAEDSPTTMEPAAEGDTMAAPVAAPSPTPGTERARRICNYCGASNDPWLTNCRSCKRPLASTGV